MLLLIGWSHCTIAGRHGRGSIVVISPVYMSTRSQIQILNLSHNPNSRGVLGGGGADLVI